MDIITHAPTFLLIDCDCVIGNGAWGGGGEGDGEKDTLRPNVVDTMYTVYTTRLFSRTFWILTNANCVLHCKLCCITYNPLFQCTNPATPQYIVFFRVCTRGVQNQTNTVTLELSISLSGLCMK